ncbi:hypothetical protein QLX08_000785 [Tetragonisca angustula]|uniref:Trissin n=1 Tax=Tetragonisca angustula TaxID=166442 RepID=A0AAW1AK99_9HYME
MNCTCVMLFLIVCASWVFGETLSCEQCGKECAEKCGTRQFRACCFNNMKKRQFEEKDNLKWRMRPQLYTNWLYPNFNIN